MNATLKAYFEEHDYLRNMEAATLGISRAVLSKMAARGDLRRVTQGVYALPDCLADELLVIASRSPNIVFSHETALALHKLHNRIPVKQSVTVPQGCNAPRSIEKTVKVYRVKPECHAIGKSEVLTFMGHKVPCYDPERTVCDIIRSYSRMDIETYTSALRSYAASRNRNLSKLLEYARTLGVEKKVKKVVEVLI